MGTYSNWKQLWTDFSHWSCMGLDRLQKGKRGAGAGGKGGPFHFFSEATIVFVQDLPPLLLGLLNRGGGSGQECGWMGRGQVLHSNNDKTRLSHTGLATGQVQLLKEHSQSCTRESCVWGFRNDPWRGVKLSKPNFKETLCGVRVCPSMDRDSHSEDTLSTMVLENIKNKLIHAFRATGETKAEAPDSGRAVRPVSIGRSFQANEELRRAQIDGAITWLRSELVRWQDRWC